MFWFHAQLQIGCVKGGGVWGSERGSGGWEDPSAPGILPGILQSLLSSFSTFSVSLLVAQGGGSGSRGG